MIILFCSSLSNAIPWPLAPTGSTHTLFHSFGDFHTAWADAAVGISFHTGIDISDPNPQDSTAYETIFNVCAGTVTSLDWDSLGGKGYSAVIVDSGVPSINGNAWLYGHISGDSVGVVEKPPIIVGQHRSPGDTLGFIAHVYSSDPSLGRVLDHLHFMRINYSKSSSYPKGVLNPLFYLDPAPDTLHFDWGWNCWPSQNNRMFALPQYDALTQWETAWGGNVDTCIAAIDNDMDAVSGAVDLFHLFNVNGEGDYGGSSFRKTMPQRLEWWLECRAADGTWTNLMADSSEYHRYLFDFGDIELGDSIETNAYKQLYFIHSPADIIPSNQGYLCCLTNVNNNSGYNGVENITENYWYTNSNLTGTA